MLPNRPLLYTNVLSKLPPVPTANITTYITTSTTTTNEDTTTTTGWNILNPHPQRLVILAVYHGVAAACTASINGINCHTIQDATHEFSLHYARVPTNTTAAVTVTAASSLRKAISMFVAYPKNPIPLDSGTVSAATTTDATLSALKVQKDGFLIYAGGEHATLGTFTTTWTGTDSVSEEVDAQLEAAASYTMGRINITISTDLSDLTMAESASGTKRLVAATWGPVY